MTLERADIVTRTAERLKIVQEGAPMASADRVTIERAVDDAYAALRNELRLTWDLDAIPSESALGLTICTAALAALPTNAPEAAQHEARWPFGEDKLRVINRLRPDNSKPVSVDYY